MSTIRVMLVNSSKMIEFYSRENQADIARKLFSEGAYSEALKIIISGPTTLKSHEDIADDLFDLTNNPSRYPDRDMFYGRQRSISVGDIVEVDSERYVCASVGWVRI